MDYCEEQITRTLVQLLMHELLDLLVMFVTA